MATSNEIRKKYLQFFEERDHAIIPSSTLVPQNDPTTLFTGSGMQPLIPYLLGETHPSGSRLVNSQKSFRAMDIEEVGDNRHTTFFEMLGNWSLGDYFKKEQLLWLFEFLTTKTDILKENLWVTCFEGDDKFHLPRDTESAEIWKSLGIPEDHISFYGTNKNWWSRSGMPEDMPVGEPGGPDSELFYEFADVQHNINFGKECHPNCECGRFMEIGNSVFMQYVKKRATSFDFLPKQNVDFGGGLERIVAASNNNPDIFKVDTLHSIITHLEKSAKFEYGTNKDTTSAYRIIADHIRAAIFLIGDGVLPGNVERGYFVRRLIRRSVRYADVLGLPEGSLSSLAIVVANEYAEHYPDILTQTESQYIPKQISDEENKFRETLSRGMKEFEKVSSGKSISGHDAFVLFTSYGFPIELTQELAQERGVSVDVESFLQEMDAHRESSRAGAEQKFKGGLADTSIQTTRLHTAHHLLLKALQIVLGEEVKQRGSNITEARLRIDFSHNQKMTPEQIMETERIVNEQISKELPVIQSTLPREEAEKLGAQMEFGQKYPDIVSIYSVGPKDATQENPQFDKAFAIEFCGGPHVTNTAEIGAGGVFKIIKEEASSAGVRRIKAVIRTS